jgi:hypothetical protein
MTDIIAMTAAEPVLNGVVKVEWADGFVAVVDLRPVFERGDLFDFLRRDPDRFATLRLDEFGRYLYWLDDEGDEIELGADSLRRRAERQAEILRLAS